VPGFARCSGIGTAGLLDISRVKIVDDAGDVQSDRQPVLIERALKQSGDLVETVDERIAMDVQVFRRPRRVESGLAPRDQRRAQCRPLAVGQKWGEQAVDKARTGIDRNDRQSLMESHLVDVMDLLLWMHDRSQLQGVEGIT
jgi:hypothetical protein